MFKLTVAAMGLAAIGLLHAIPAWAQKSKDTLRYAENDQYSVLNPYDFADEQASSIYSEIYSPLILVDELNHKILPELASAWRRVDDKTLEFDLRDDITLHSGKHFNADDVIAAVNYAIDPKVRIRSKNRYTWVASIEKLGPYKARVHMAEVFPLDLVTFSYRFVVEDSEVLKSLENQADYGRVSAASAGPYKLVSFDRNTGFQLERFDQLKIAHRRAPIQHIQIVPVTDPQTQVAQLLTGGLDLITNVSEDNARELAKQKNVTVTPTKSGQYVYFMMDSIARSGVKEFTDQRVRQAFVMAINRQEIATKVVPGGDKAGEVQNNLCYPFNAACPDVKPPYAYDPAAAKKLLADAGYPNGFDMTLYAHEPYKDVAVAIAGDLRKIGVRASVQPMGIATYTKMREDGKLTTFVGIRPTSTSPETIDIMEGFFEGSRDYWKDDLILTALGNARKVADDRERAQVLKPALERNNEQAYVVPIASQPWVYAHSAELRIGENPQRPRIVHISDVFWK